MKKTPSSPSNTPPPNPHTNEHMSNQLQDTIERFVGRIMPQEERHTAYSTYLSNLHLYLTNKAQQYGDQLHEEAKIYGTQLLEKAELLKWIVKVNVEHLIIQQPNSINESKKHGTDLLTEIDRFINTHSLPMVKKTILNALETTAKEIKKQHPSYLNIFESIMRLLSSHQPPSTKPQNNPTLHSGPALNPADKENKPSSLKELMDTVDEGQSQEESELMDTVDEGRSQEELTNIVGMNFLEALTPHP